MSTQTLCQSPQLIDGFICYNSLIHSQRLSPPEDQTSRFCLHLYLYSVSHYFSCLSLLFHASSCLISLFLGFPSPPLSAQKKKTTERSCIVLKKKRLQSIKDFFISSLPFSLLLWHKLSPGGQRLWRSPSLLSCSDGGGGMKSRICAVGFEKAQWVFCRWPAALKGGKNPMSPLDSAKSVQ